MKVFDKLAEPRLTSLSHGGGCGCKIAPGVLSEILKGTTSMSLPDELLVGIETAAPALDEVLALCRRHGFEQATVIATIAARSDKPRVVVI
jgi:selenophosphate synthase